MTAPEQNKRPSHWTDIACTCRATGACIVCRRWSRFIRRVESGIADRRRGG